MDIYLNGEMLPQDKAMVSAADAGFQHSVGLFETMLAGNGRVFRLQHHLDRLLQSAQTLGLAVDIDIDELMSAVVKTLSHNQLSDARVRLTVTPGPVGLLRGEDPAGKHQPTVLVVAELPTQYDPAYFEKGISTIVIPNAANPFDELAGHKTLAYWGRLRTLRMAAAAGAGEAIWLSVSNHLASGAVSNLFLVKDGTLYTPIARGEEVAGAIPAPVRPGVTREVIFELAKKNEIDVKKQMLTIEDLLDADEVFLTNSSWLILPVTKVEKKEIGSQGIGEMTKVLREQLIGLIEQETAE